MQTKPLGILLACGLFCASAAHAQTPSDILVRDAWVREATATQRATGAYLTIDNRSTMPVALVGARIPGVGVVELHTTKIENDRMKMERVTEIVVPAGGTVTLEPGGLHLMLFQLGRAFEAGETAEVTLQFAGGEASQVTASVRKRMQRPSQEAGR
jgi:hypothetical protein